MPEIRSSRLSGFYQKSVAERVALLAEWAQLSPPEQAMLENGLQTAQADKMVENVVGRYSLPLGIVTNFLINGKDYLIPMVVEEPSVVAAVSNAARIIRAGGGFRTGSSEPIMIAQIQLLEVPNPLLAETAILHAKAELLALANTSPSIAARGGGPRDIQVRHLAQTPTEAMLIVHLLFDVRDAMGANAVNTAAEAISPRLEELSGGRALLRILSNYSDQRRAWAEVTIPAEAFDTQTKDNLLNSQFAIHNSQFAILQNIAHANAFAVADPYRAATHNKGIFNGIDAVALATGNDWRAIEAGGHAWAARDGQYRALTTWEVRNAEGGMRGENDSATIPHSAFRIPPASSLFGRLELPLAVGIVGGSTKAHPTAQVALKILNVASARELSEVMAAVGLAQNLAALQALTTEGIQRGHMRLHARKS